MKKTLFVLCAGLLVATSAWGAASPMLGSSHDMRPYVGATTTEVCAFCHTPHDSILPAGFAIATRGTNTYPLWNHTLSIGQTYVVYDSQTMAIHPNTGDYSDFTSGSNVSTMLCLSCHDGTVAVWDMNNGPNLAGQSGDVDYSGSAVALNNVNVGGFLFQGPGLLGTDLTNDHPVNINYDVAQGVPGAELNASTGGASVDDGTWALPLFNTRVECATCHNPHDTTTIAFLRVANTNSQLCTTCHVK